jgi:nucleoside-diphosphate-sugar epimerase
MAHLAKIYLTTKTSRIMNIFITGATGYIGNQLAHTLADEGHCVHALIRNKKMTGSLQHRNIKIFFGDLNNREEIRAAMSGCEQAYHVAGQVRSWMKDPSIIYKVNVEGTSNVFKEAIYAGITKVVFTSTCGVIGPSLKEPMTENDPRITGFALDYELSKKMAEDVVQQFMRMGLDIVIVSPSKVYGPGQISHSLTYNAFIKKFLRSGIALIPYPGNYQGCFGYLDDIVRGHILAMEKGRTGEKYILGGVNISYKNFFQEIKKITGHGAIISIPKFIVKAWAYWQWIQYKTFHKDPLFTPGVINHFFRNYIFSSDKAIAELGYRITPFEEAIHKTVHFLNPPNHD